MRYSYSHKVCFHFAKPMWNSRFAKIFKNHNRGGTIRIFFFEVGIVLRKCKIKFNWWSNVNNFARKSQTPRRNSAIYYSCLFPRDSRWKRWSYFTGATFGLSTARLEPTSRCCAWNRRKRGEEKKERKKKKKKRAKAAPRRQVGESFKVGNLVESFSL